MGYAVSDEVSSTFQGPPGLDGMKVSDPRDDPVLHSIDYSTFLFGRAISVLFAPCDAFVRDFEINTPILDRLERETRARGSLA